MANREIVYNQKIFNISYDIINPAKTTSLIILHGWGSNKEIMKQAFKNVFPNFKHIYIDMPGFGKSSNEFILRTKDYEQIIDMFLNTLKINKDIIIGHSFGGKVATLLNPKLLVLLSSAGIVTKKPLSVQIKIKLFKLLKILGGSKLYTLFASKDVQGMDKTMYETFKNVVDENFEEIFSSYDKKALLFWGKDDKATPLISGEKIHSLIKQNNFYSYEGDHYFFLHHTQKISDTIGVEYENI